jgi:hypothetical protein
MRFRKILLFTLLLFPKLLSAQSYEKEYVTLFAWQVKQIDEFIERFNDNDSTLIRQYTRKTIPAVALTREKLIKSLFNARQKNWNFQQIIQFIKQVDDKDHPEYLDFYQDKWQANVLCSITRNGIPGQVLLRLKIENTANGGSKWVIFDVDSSFLRQHRGAALKSLLSQPVLPGPVDNETFLSPVSHTTDFFNIDQVSSETKSIGNFLAPSPQYSRAFCLFINECIDHQLKIVKVNSITYSFYQIKGWDIEIQQFNRDTRNSGWLISKLIKLPS